MQRSNKRIINQFWLFCALLLFLFLAQHKPPELGRLVSNSNKSVKDWAEPNAIGTAQLFADFMLSIKQAKKIEPKLEYLTDEEVLEVLNDMYGLGQLAYEKWQKVRFQKSNEVIAL